MPRKPKDDKESETTVDQTVAQQGGDKPTWVYCLAPDVHELAAKLIHEQMDEIVEVEILYLFTSKARKVRGREVYGNTIKLNPLQRFLDADKEAAYDGSDFAVIISWDWWLGHTSLKDRRALLHHQLAFIGSKENDDGDVAWILRGPDVSEFAEVVVAEGAWNADLVMMSNALQQLRMPIEPENEEKAV